MKVGDLVKIKCDTGDVWYGYDDLMGVVTEIIPSKPNVSPEWIWVIWSDGKVSEYPVYRLEIIKK
jgi:hypothetical protein